MKNGFIIYTDGSSRGNPGPGGWGVIIIENNNDSSKQLVVSSKVKEMGGRESRTTNNRMEMRAVIEALKFLSRTVLDTNIEVEVHIDSEYVMKGATLWIKNWLKNNWKTKNKKPVLNQDLWQELLFQMEARKVSWKKVLGHSGHKYNERCDAIATSFADAEKIKLYDGEKSLYKI